jgi:hypothetical protein
MKRAAVCIGVNRPTGMAALSAAARDAADFRAWAEEQGCDTVLLTDAAATAEVTLADVFKAVKGFVRSGTYDQLVVYFSGHGILLAPGAEYWLLSGGPENPNEAVNLLRSVEDARNSGIPHVVFVSDACRSAANTQTLRAVTGGLIFPPQPSPRSRSEIDVYYATLPGDPANEVPEADATRSHRGLFTDCLLAVVARPPHEMIESAAEGAATISVLTSRRLKPYLETVVPEKAADIDVRLNQSPEIRVETALPKYFARIEVTRSAGAPLPVPAAPAPTVQSALRALRDSVLEREGAPASLAAQPARAFATELGLDAEVTRLATTQGRGHFETRTGFTVHGAQVALVTSLRWNTDPPFQEPVQSGGTLSSGWHVRLNPQDGFSFKASSILLEFDTGTATVLPVLPGFIGTVVVEGGRVISVNFRPSEGTSRFGEYQAQAARLDEMKAFAAVAARVGRFEVEFEKASRFADRIRQAKGIDPIMGLYAAYAYAQAGEFDDVYSVFTWMREDEIELPIPFDVAMLALRHRADALEAPDVRIAPFVPMLSQGWALLMPGDRMHRPIHQRLRPHLLPSLFTTLDAEGARIARTALTTGEEK